MYKLQICCIVILLCVLSLFFSVRFKRTKIHKLFFVMLVVSILQIVSDIVTVYTVNHLDSVPEWLNLLAHKVFMILILAVVYIVYKYVVVLIEEEIGRTIKWRRAADFLMAGCALGGVCLPLFYMEGKVTNYSYGPGWVMVYLCIAVYLVMMILAMFRFRDVMSIKKRMAITCVLFSEMGVSVYQMFQPESLISSMGVMMLCVGCYLAVENPDSVLVERLAEERERADMANNAKSRFLSNMSHEIRTPINAVLGMNELILRETRDSDIIQYAMDIKSSAKSLLNIINDILDVNKIEEGKMSIISVDYEICSVLHDVRNMISLRAEDKGLKLHIEIDNELPAFLRGDDIRIKQVLLNLLSNAVKYTKEGDVFLRVQGRGIKENRVSIYFEVQDTGIGIKKEDMDKLFQPFERIEEGRNRHIEGTGLGMNITMNLLHMMNSELNVRSTYGEGSVFSFVLEQEVVNDSPVGDFAKRLSEMTDREEYTAMFEAPDAKVLVVDDNAMNRKVFRSLIKDTKIQITEASGGQECIELVQKEYFDIIFMDHLMPELDGIETLKCIRQLGDYPCKETPVVILTANAIAGVKERYLKEGFDAYLSKPIVPKKLEKMLYKLLDDKLVHDVENPSDEGQEILLDKGKKSGEKETKLPLIDGVDWSFAGTHFRDQRSMLEMLEFFYRTIDSEADELEICYQDIRRQEGRELYKIKVHSMKNSAATLGIVPLAGVAKMLEDASGQGDLDTLESVHPIFVKKWRSYRQLLSVFVEEEEKIPANEENLVSINMLLSEIRRAAGEMDIDRLDEIMEQLDRYEFPPEWNVKIDAVRRAVTDFNVEYLMQISDL